MDSGTRGPDLHDRQGAGLRIPTREAADQPNGRVERVRLELDAGRFPPGAGGGPAVFEDDLPRRGAEHDGPSPLRLRVSRRRLRSGGGRALVVELERFEVKRDVTGGFPGDRLAQVGRGRSRRPPPRAAGETA